MRVLEKYSGYTIAVAGSVAVLMGRLLLRDVFEERAQFVPFVLAVIGAAWWGGLWPGITATLLGAALGTYFIMWPYESLRIERLSDGAHVGMFIFVGLAISGLCEALHKAKRGEADKQFRILADSVAQLVWMATPDGRGMWFNRRWGEYTGKTLAQLKDEGWLSFCGADDLPRVAKSWRAALASGAPWEDIFALRRADGQMRWHLSRAVPVRGGSGHIARWCCTSTDIQDRVAAERALQEADARKDKYIATLAHELRNPLSAISSALQLCRRVPHDAAEVENAQSIMSRHVKQLVRLIDDLLDVARISSGRIVLRRALLDLEVVIAGAVETVRPLLAAAGHELTVSYGDGPVYVDGDETRLKQVFVNILHNAVKYTPDKGTISVVMETCAGGVRVRVRDSGAGIPENLLTAVFDAFYQAETTLGCSQGGLGIGLTLCKQLVELHGGTIEAHSAGAGKGSEFVVTLPVSKALPSTSVPAAGATPARPAVGCRVLVVDDLRDCADNLAKLLRSRGHDAASLYDGQHAIEWALAHRPDAVLLDIAMPGLDGYEVARRMRRAGLSTTALVALTGFGQQDDRRRALEAGFDFHVTKPPDIDELEDLLSEVCSQDLPVNDAAVACARENIVFVEEVRSQ